ncbi:MAG: hypothetical protein MR008_00365 [Aerococcus sp.]|nr:hypothetical protein [Aerococcus sp.]
MKPSRTFNRSLLLIQLLLLINPFIMPVMFNATLGIHYTGSLWAVLIAIGMLFCLEQLYYFFSKQPALLFSTRQNYIIALDVVFLILTLINFFQAPFLIAILPLIQLLIVHSYWLGNRVAPKSHLIFFPLQLLLFQCYFLYTVHSLVPGFRMLLISLLTLIASIWTVQPFFMPARHQINKPAAFGLGLFLFFIALILGFWLTDARWYMVLLFIGLMIITSVPVSFLYYRSNHTLVNQHPANNVHVRKRRGASDSYNNRRR